MRIVYWGKGPRGQVCLQQLLQENFNIVGVFSEAMESPGERWKTLHQLADSKHIPYHIIDSPRSQETQRLVKSFEADIFILAGYTRILPPSLINLAPMGIINLHGGRIPDYRGCAPIPWQIIRGEEKIGLTVLYANEGIDTGDVLMEETFKLALEEGATEAIEELLKRFPRMLVTVLKGLQEGHLQGKAQDLSTGGYYTRRYPEDGLIDCRTMTAKEIFNLIRALRDPYPGAFAWRGDKKIVLQRAELLNEEILGVPGRIPLKRKNGIVLIAKDRGILITEVRQIDKIVPAINVFSVKEQLSPYPQ